MDWQTRRKIIYALATVITIGAITVYFLRDVLFPEPTCFDKKQNGYEVGADCGGMCSLRCTSEVAPLTVLWAQAIKTTKVSYDLVAMVSNKNIDNASNEISYTFTVYNKQGTAIGEMKGKTLAPVDGDFPIIKQSIAIPQEPYKVTLQIEDGPHYKVHEKPTSPTLSIANERYEQGAIPRVYATIRNNKRTTVSDLPIRIVLYDENNNAYAVGETYVARLDKEEIKDISVTWDAPLPFAPTRIRVYPIFNPFVAIE